MQRSSTRGRGCSASALAILALLLCLPGCSGDGDGPTTPPSTDGTPIGIDGGTVSSDDGNATVTIPAGALPATVNFSIEPCDTCPSGPLTGSAYTFLPHGQHFDLPVQLSIGYDPAQLPAGAWHSDLRLARLLGDLWLGLAGAEVDSVANVLEHSLTHFSTYGVVVAGGDGEVSEATVYVVDEPDAADEFASLAAAIDYLQSTLDYEDLGTVVIQTTAPQEVESLAFAFDLALRVDGIPAATIVGPGAQALVVNAVGALNLASIHIVNAGGLDLNANRNLTVEGCTLPEGTAINYGGVKSAPYPAADPSFVAKRGAKERAFGSTVSDNSIGEGLGVSWQAGVSVTGGYSFANNSGPDASFGGPAPLGAGASLELQYNGWSGLHMGMKLSGDASISATGQSQLENWVFEPTILDGSHSLQLESNITGTFTAGITGVGEVDFTVRNSTTNGSSDFTFDGPRIHFASDNSTWPGMFINLAASFISDPDYNLDLAGAVCNGPITIGGVDAPGGLFTAGIREMTVMGDVSFDLNWEARATFDDAEIHGRVNAAFEGNLRDWRSFSTEFRGGVDLIIDEFMVSAEVRFEQDEFYGHSQIRVPEAAVFVLFTIIGAETKDYGTLDIGGGFRAASERQDTPIVVSGGSFVTTGLSPALQIHDIDVPVTIQGATFRQESSQTAPLNLGSLGGDITIDDCDFFGSGITINDCTGAATISNCDMNIDQPLGFAVSSLSSPGATITDCEVICGPSAGVGITDSAENGPGSISNCTITSESGFPVIWAAGGTIDCTDNTLLTGGITVYGLMLFAGNTCAGCQLMDLNFDGGLLADPMQAGNTGLSPENIWTYCDWNGNGCCDYPPANDQMQDGQCVCDGVEPPGGAPSH